MSTSMNVSDRRDKIISETIVFHIFFMASKNMLVSNSSYLFSINSMLNTISAVIVAFVYLRMIVLLKGRLSLKKNTVLAVFLIILFCLFTFLIDPIRFISTAFPYNYVRIQATTFIIYCFPLFICVSMLSSFDLLIDKLMNAAWVLFLFATIAFGFKIIENKDLYSMSFGYNALWCFIIWSFKYRKTMLNVHLIPVVLTAFYILVAGSRGPLLCIAATIIYLFLGRAKDARTVSLMIVLMLLGGLVIVYYKSILQLLIDFLNQINVSSRTLIVLQRGTAGYADDREAYHQGIIHALNRRPLLGLGAFGGEATVGLAHGLFYDILANFGYVFGSIYILVMLFYSYRFCIKKANESLGIFFSMLACLSLPISLVDSEFWVSKELWMMMGAIIVYKNRRLND